VTTQRNGPPHGEAPASQEEPAPTTTRQVDTTHNSPTRGVTTFRRPATPQPLPRSCPTGVPAQLRARRAASRRLPVGPCGRHSDPLVCSCFDPEPALTERYVDSWRSTIERTLPIGTPLGVPIEVLQRLHRNGGRDRQLAQQVWIETGGLIT
jgi:hypothetical protein